MTLSEMKELALAATPGEWHWIIHDHSMASLGVGNDPGMDDPLVLNVSPCQACADRADPKEWKWGRCGTPSEANAAFIAACHPQAILAFIAELEAKDARIRELEGALRPFAKIELPPEADDGTWVARTLYCNDQVTAHSVRRALAALTGPEGK